nr:hypothetical protein [Tanacetum cinerariifolium]
GDWANGRMTRHGCTVAAIRGSEKQYEVQKKGSTSDEVFQANHFAQNEKSLENSSEEIAVSNPNQEKEEPPQDSDIHQLIEECSTEVCEEQKQSMEDTMLELVKICQEKKFLCIHDNEVKNVVEQPVERGNRSIQSLQNFRVVHKNSISLNNTSQISSIHAVAPILSIEEPEHSLSMGYEHLSITPETESDEVTESNVENLLPIPSECEVTLEDEIYDDNFKDIEYVEALLSDPEIDNVEEENVVQQEEEEVDLEDISQIQDVVLRAKLLSITRLISNIESLNDNSTPDCVLNSFESDNSLSDNFLPEFKTFYDHSKETRSGNTTHADNSLPEYDSFCFEIEPDQERLINLVKNDIPDDSLTNSLLEEANLFLASDNSIPPCIENFANDSKGDYRFLEELLINDSILSHESYDSKFEDNPSILRPPPETPDAETDTEEGISVVMNNKDKFDKDYHFFMFDKVFSLFFDESEDTIFDLEIWDDMITGRKEGSSKNTYSKLSGRGLSSRSEGASLFDPENVSIEEENVDQQEEEEVDFEDISQIQDVVLHEKLLSITCLISNIESLNDNPTPDRVFNSFESDNSLLDNFSPEFKTFCDHSEETRSGNTTHANYSLSEYDSFCFEIEPDQERLINLVKNNIFDNSSNDPLLKEVYLILFDNSIPSGIENIADDPEGDIRFLEELLIDDSILSHESFDSYFEDNPLIPRPPPEPTDAETDIGEEIPVVMNDKDKFDDDSQFFMFDKEFSFFSAESEDTIFDSGIFD